MLSKVHVQANDLEIRLHFVIEIIQQMLPGYPVNAPLTHNGWNIQGSKSNSLQEYFFLTTSFIWEKERSWEWEQTWDGGGAEGQDDSTPSRVQGPQDYDLHRSQMLNWLSHPGAPSWQFLKINCFWIKYPTNSNSVFHE